jgi:integrase
MPVYKLTATKIDKHKPAKDDERLTDGNGLFLRFRRDRSGSFSRTWMYAYKSRSKSIYLTLGEHDASLPDFETTIYKLAPGARLTLENARRIAVELTDWRRRDLDPKEFLQNEMDRLASEMRARAAAEAHLDQQRQVDSLTVTDMFNAWLQDGVRRKDGNAELQRSFKADVLPKIGNQPIRTLTEHDLRGLLRVMVGRGVNRAAVVLRNNLTQMLAWAEKRQPWRKLLVDGNPMDLIEIRKIVSRDYDLSNQRDRILSEDEIRELRDTFDSMQAEYDAAPNRRTASQPVEGTVQCAIWIMLSTLCRVGELSMARWEHLNLDSGEWRIPRENVKGNLNDFTVYLSDFSMAQFRRLHAITGHDEWCFPARSRGGHVDVKSISKQVGDRQAMFKVDRNGAPRKPMKNRRHDNRLVLGNGRSGAWTPHDLRRTGATMMQGLGVGLDIIDRCQNHVLAGSKIRRHYLHHTYAQEKREAWQLLGFRVMQILASTDNIVLLRAI